MFIAEFPGMVAPEVCEDIIARFERDPSRKPSVVMSGGAVRAAAQIRTGTVLPIERYMDDDWRKVTDELTPILVDAMNRYCGLHPGLQALADAEGLVCTRPMVERVDPGQGFDWHADQAAAHRSRVVAGLLYLRTIHDGGHTEFRVQQRKVQPEAGKIVLFPPDWTHVHRGVTPAHERKYVMSFFWIYARAPRQE